MADFAQYWYFHLPNFILAAVMYTIIGRLVLGLVAPEDWDNYIWVAFKRITQPFVRPVRFLTPSILGDRVVLIFAVLWLMLLRVLYFAAMAGLGLAPQLEG
jgi:uncharacterized protein YggT (Ycf19 family)